ncbi:MAG: hypothetical protein QGH54_09660 [SAR202 cluster bacterium]|nr:hypothetical protein [SAR202 cluster bacterium]
MPSRPWRNADIELGRMIRRLIGEDIELINLPHPDMISVAADLGQIEQVLVNLVVNARDATLAGGRITVETTVEELGSEQLPKTPGLKPGAYARLAVRDEGVG